MTAWSDIESQVQTGDLVLCHGTGRLSATIEVITLSEYSHATMAVRLKPDGPVYLWQEAPAPLGADPEAHDTQHGGAQLGPAAQVIAEMHQYGDTPHWLPLVYDRPANFDDQVIAVIAGVDGRPFPTLKGMLLEWIEGKLDIAASDTTLFCAELVAITYQQLGLLPPEPPANGFDPGTFARADASDRLLLGARFGTLEEITAASSDAPSPTPPAPHLAQEHAPGARTT
jgi:hypothetical protein